MTPMTTVLCDITNSTVFNIRSLILNVVEANLCSQDPWEVKGKGITGVADKEVCTVCTLTIISQQYFLAHCLISYAAYVFGLFVCFLLTS